MLEAATLGAHMQERAEGDYTSSHVSGGSRFVPWVISKKERAQLPIGTLRKLRKLECEVGQPARWASAWRHSSAARPLCTGLPGAGWLHAHASGDAEPLRSRQHEGLWSRGCGATASACEILRPGTLDTQDVRERKKLPGSVAKLIKGYELRAWWFEIFECGRKARPLAFQHMPRVGTDRPSAIADPLDAALTPRTCSHCAAVYRVPSRLLPALWLVRSAGLRPDGLLPGLRRLRPL